MPRGPNRPSRLARARGAPHFARFCPIFAAFSGKNGLAREIAKIIFSDFGLTSQSKPAPEIFPIFLKIAKSPISHKIEFTLFCRLASELVSETDLPPTTPEIIPVGYPTSAQYQVDELQRVYLILHFYGGRL